jgi:hypothetical protein
VIRERILKMGKKIVIGKFEFTAKRECYYCQTSHYFGGSTNTEKWGWQLYYNSIPVEIYGGITTNVGTTNPRFKTFKELKETLEMIEDRRMKDCNESSIERTLKQQNLI